MEENWRDKETMVTLYSSDWIRNDTDVANFFNERGQTVSRRTITDARNELGIPAKSKASLFNVEQEALDKDREDLWSLVESMQNELRKDTYAKKDIVVNLTSNEPIGVFFMGDLHIGDIGTDHKALNRDIKLINQTENLFGTMGGDYINNFIKGTKKIKNHEILPVEFAWKLTKDVFERLSDSLWAILLGNHDEWTDQQAEVDYLAEMVENLGVPYGKHGTNIHINFPDQQTYKIRLRHKFRFESQINLLNSVKQMYRQDEPFDIGVLHHLHTPGYEMWMQPPTGVTYAVRPGSYKVEDDFAYALGYSSNGVGMSSKFGTDQSCRYSIPVAIMWPGERRIHMCSNIRDGISYLSFARESYQKEGI